MSVKKLLEDSKKQIDRFFSHFDPRPLEELVNFLKEGQGLIFLSGIGKSGFVAEKIAATLTSTGTRAFFLSVQDSLHGDIGWVQKGDVVILLSKSGESEELLTLVPYLRNRGAHLVALTANAESRLARAAHRIVSIPFEKELGPLDMVPTLSTTFQMIMGDLLAISLMEDKAISSADFARNHPAGRIGKRLIMKVEDLMIKGENLPIAHLGTKLIDALVDFTNKKAGCLLIVDEVQKLVGIFTDGDLRRSLQKWGGEVMDMPLAELMGKEPKSIEKDLLLFEALKIMEKDQGRPITVLPVTEPSKKLIGLIKLHDILQAGI